MFKYKNICSLLLLFLFMNCGVFVISAVSSILVFNLSRVFDIDCHSQHLECDLAVVKFTHIRCKSLDPKLVRIQRCYTRPISRNVTETSLLVSLARAISNITVRLSFMKKSTDYSLYFGERTYDACKFLANRKLYRIADYLFGIIEEYANMNQSCPYQVPMRQENEGDIIIDRLRIRNDKLTWLPMPEGEYAIYTFWKIDGKSSAEFNLFFSYK